ncbi:MAG: hypothetical protein GY940_32340 [bacterium]|nr:hypothetical protein [bacterium]
MELSGVDLNTHLKAVVTELQHNESIYGYPKKKFYTGFPGIDLSVDFMGQAASTPLGPAAGPHTQLAQNIILSFLGGGRIMELKTVQILDQLEIPRPCIDIPNIGFNVEWSQELSLEAAYQEYVVAWILLHIIEEMELLDVPKGSPFYNTVFDLSVGYDLKGIQTGRVTGWINQMKDSSHEIRKQLEALPHEFSRFKSLKIDPHIGKSVTLSTFHGCPPGEIESIVEYFLKELNLHVNVKMNPTLLGYDFVERTLRQQLGYDNIELDPEAFEKDLHFDDGVAMMKRLEKLARERGLRLGAKFTNTLVVKNNKDVFKDELMYLSGPPLHVISMNTMHRFRKEMSPGFSISFSAGLNKKNFADSAACNLVPMTVCSDLLKNGGFTRMKVYLDNLSKAMNSVGAVNMAEYIQKKGLNQARNLNNDLHEATMANCETLIPNLVDDPQYHQQQNSKPPRKIDSQLEFYDCLTCNICLAV